jgi:hypothetical protein
MRRAIAVVVAVSRAFVVAVVGAVAVSITARFFREPSFTRGPWGLGSGLASDDGDE